MVGFKLDSHNIRLWSLLLGKVRFYWATAERTHPNVVGSNPARSLAFLFFFFLYYPTLLHQWSVLNQFSPGGASLTKFCESKKLNA